MGLAHPSNLSTDDSETLIVRFTVILDSFVIKQFHDCFHMKTQSDIQELVLNNRFAFIVGDGGCESQRQMGRTDLHRGDTTVPIEYWAARLAPHTRSGCLDIQSVVLTVPALSHVDVTCMDAVVGEEYHREDTLSDAESLLFLIEISSTLYEWESDPAQ